ncbi:MAG: serine/threonine-protein kinase [Microthrixaceae bacterium]
MSEAGMRPIRSSGLPTRVRLIERVGKGTFGEVWLARDTREGIDVAVKFLDGDATELAGERFEREVRSLARLSDIPGIVAIRELGLAPDGTPWLVTKYLAGGSLGFKLEVAAPEPFSADARSMVSDLLTPLASALAAAHNVGVFHGDISPGNVLYDESGRPWLSDFGMATLGAPRPSGAARNPVRSGGSDTPDPRELGAYGISGFTPAYAAPERLRGAMPGPRSDVYSLAATLWHVLAGAPRLGAVAGERPRRDTHGDGDRVDGTAAGNAGDGDFGDSGYPGGGVDPLLGMLEAAMDKAPGLRPSAMDLVEFLASRDSRRRRWRYRRSDGNR